MIGSLVRRAVRALHNSAGATDAVAPRLLEELEQRQVLAASIINGQALPDSQVLVNSGPIVVPLGGRYQNDVSAITGSVFYFDFVGFGRVFVEMFDALPNAPSETRTRTTPQMVSNFRSYVNANRYQNTIIHRSITDFIVQGGGFTRPDVNDAVPASITTFAPVNNEPGNLNVRGTVALAQQGTNVNSGTSQFFFNLADNDFLDINRPGVGGPFSAFGAVIGNGMNIIDLVEAVPKRNANQFYGLDPTNGPFSTIPLRNFSSAPVTPGNFVTISNVVEDDSLEALSQMVFTARSNNSSLASATVDESGNLVLNLGANKGGTASITVRATAADGTFVEDTFTLTVIAPPTVGTLKVSPAVLSAPGASFTLTAGGVVARGTVITAVEFWVDGNGNGTFEEAEDVFLGEDTSAADGGYKLTFATVFENENWDPGTYAFFARALDSADQISNVVTVDGRINELPTVGNFAGTPNPVPRLTSVLFNINSVLDDTKVSKVEVFIDTNGNGSLDIGVDKRLGNAKRVAGTNDWTFAGKTKGLPAGLVRFFASAIDENKGRSEALATQVQINNLAPTITSIKTSPVIVPALDRTVKVSGVKIKDLDGKINRFEVWRDMNDNGVVDGEDILLAEKAPAVGAVAVTGGFTVNIVASEANGFAYGDNAVLGRVRDTDNDWSSPAALNLHVNHQPFIEGALVFTPNPISQALKFGLTVATVGDVDSAIKTVELIHSVTNGVAPQAGDKVLAKAKFNTLTGRFEFANVSASKLPLGLVKFFIRATDVHGGTSFVTQEVTVVA